MRPRDNRSMSLQALAGPIERLAQANIALILVQAVIIRLSIEIANGSDGDPDPLMLLAFLAVCGIAVALVVVLGRVIRRFPRRWLRVAIALGTVIVQSAAFQLIHDWAS